MHKTFFKKPRKNKYGNKKSRCALNHIHDSAFEASHCNNLLKKREKGEIADFKSQKRFDLHGKDGKKVAAHYVDFLVLNNDGTEVVNECKSRGTVTPIWKLKKALFECEYQDIEYITVWMN
jgi:hypothetical protein